MKILLKKYLESEIVEAVNKDHLQINSKRKPVTHKLDFSD
jgi:hypothetical protein